MDVLRAKLNLVESDFPDDCDISSALSSILIEATNGKSTATFSLDRVYRAILAAQFTEQIDPLTVIPLLLPSTEDIAQDVLDAIAEQTSAKELVIACEEASERLKTNLIHASEEEDDDLDSLTGDAENIKLSPAQQVVRLLRIYARALPRLRRGKRTASAIAKPLFSEMELLIRFFGQNAEVDDGRDLAAAVAQLALSLAPWISADTDDKSAASEIVYSLTISTLEVCAESLSEGVAQRAFAKQFPRLRMPPKEDDASPSHRNIVRDILQAFSQVGFTTPDFEKRASVGSLVLLSHTEAYSPSLSIVQSFLPVIMTSIQTNTALEDTLAFLLTAFGPLSSVKPRIELSPDLLVPLTHVLPPLAGAHPDAPIRHVIFRLLSLILSLAHPTLRFQLLQELLTDTDATSEQMRVAAVGLVKEAVLEGLSSPAEAHHSIFASSRFMQTFAPIIFKPRLPESAEDAQALREFLESPEPLRLVEGLGLYYVVLQRDAENRTGIRDADSMQNVEKELLSVLRRRIELWNQVLESSEPDADATDEDLPGHDTLQLGILEMWIDRTQGVMNALRTSPPLSES